MYFGFQNITVGYAQKTVLEQVTLEVCCGEILCVIGPNGCGKTSLLRTISRMLRPSTGHVEYRDKPIHVYSRKQLAKKIAYLPQVHVALPDVDVKTLVSYGRFPYLSRTQKLTAADTAVIQSVLSRTQLLTLQDRPLSTLSGGERQRARIAMALCQQPEILVLDEPTTHLDIHCQIELLELVKELNQDTGMTILLVLHDLNLAAQYAHRLALIEKKRISAVDVPHNILTAENLKRVFHIDSMIQKHPVYGCPYFLPLSMTDTSVQTGDHL